MVNKKIKTELRNLSKEELEKRLGNLEEGIVTFRGEQDRKTQFSAGRFRNLKREKAFILQLLNEMVEK